MAAARVHCCTHWRVSFALQAALSVAAAGPGRAQLALVPQNPDLTLFCRTVREELAFGPQQLGLAEAKVRSRVHEAAEAMAVLDLLEEPPLALSQGQRLRVAPAAALTLRPQLLMLDEPTTGQDPAEVRRLMEPSARQSYPAPSARRCLRRTMCC